MKRDYTARRSRRFAASASAPSCSVLLRPAPSCSVLLRPAPSCSVLLRPAPSCSVLLRPAPSCSVLLRPAPSCSVLLRPAPSCSVLLRPAPSCSVLLRPAPQTKRPVSSGRTPRHQQHSLAISAADDGAAPFAAWGGDSFIHARPRHLRHGIEAPDRIRLAPATRCAASPVEGARNASAVREPAVESVLSNQSTDGGILMRFTGKALALVLVASLAADRPVGPRRQKRNRPQRPRRKWCATRPPAKWWRPLDMAAH